MDKQAQMRSFDEILSALNQQNITQTSKEKGTLFEKLTKRILEISPYFNFKEIYLWSEFSDKFHIGYNDSGIDLMALDSSGEWTSIQCKFFGSSSKLKQDDVDSFLRYSTIIKRDGSIFCSVSQKILFHTCKNVSENVDRAVKQAQAGYCRVISHGYDDLANNLGIDWASFAQNKAKSQKGDFSALSLKPKKTLREHQKAAHKAVLEYFLEKRKSRGKVIMACGTGKSLLAIRILDSILKKGEIALFLAPSLALLNQMIKEFFIESNGDYKVFAVCSDSKVGGNSNKINVYAPPQLESSEDIPPNELLISPTTDAQKLSNIINPLKENAKIVIFSTYQSIDAIILAQNGTIANSDKNENWLNINPFKKPFKIIVNDEAHRTAGYQKLDKEKSNPAPISMWQKTHDNDLLNAEFRLYMTATPRIYAENEQKRDEIKKELKEKSNNDLLLFDMGDEEIFGEEIYSLKFGEAIEKGLLSDYRVLISFVNKQTLAAYLGKKAKAQEKSILDR